MLADPFFILSSMLLVLFDLYAVPCNLHAACALIDMLNLNVHRCLYFFVITPTARMILVKFALQPNMTFSETQSRSNAYLVMDRDPLAEEKARPALPPFAHRPSKSKGQQAIKFK
jgi:hypothetical protein